jgi:hypothetical protein
MFKSNILYPLRESNPSKILYCSWVLWCMPIVPATQEAKAEGSYEPQGQPWQSYQDVSQDQRASEWARDVA